MNEPDKCVRLHVSSAGDSFLFGWPCRFDGELLLGSLRVGDVIHTAPCSIKIPPIQAFWFLSDEISIKGNVYKDTRTDKRLSERNEDKEVRAWIKNNPELGRGQVVRSKQ